MGNKQSELIKTLTDKELLQNLYLTQMTILVIGIVISKWLTGRWFSPLDNIHFQIEHILMGFVIGLSVVFLELILYKILPSSWFDDGGINSRIFLKRSPLHILVLTVVIAFSEEFLFRGVLQTNFGLWIASFLFAIIHIRYLSNLFLFSFTVLLSISLGFLYYFTDNLLTVIVAHFTIDFILGLMIRYSKIK
ncbi:lysostaphin resistance A-like protein [Salipaludibacillus sp. CF4.18]|uniref:CPBP family intramembrane glutamic endopeptidase n=1 Tax=Salipaludibacillus sp. CF4.18 TaxID=3373081 RepID=UPI003EE46224